MHPGRSIKGIDAESVPRPVCERQARKRARTAHGKTLSSIGGDMADSFWGVIPFLIALIVYVSYVL